MINDISGLSFDPRMAGVLAEFRPAVVLMHTPARPDTMQKHACYPDVIDAVWKSLTESVQRAESAGLDRILVDPGIGFGKTTAHNFQILARLTEFKSLGRPLLVGLSRKSLIGKTLGIPPEDRLPATVALNLQALLRGAAIIRVHDVLDGRQTVLLFESLRRHLNI